MTSIVARVIGLAEAGAYQPADRPPGDYAIPHDAEDQQKHHLSYLRKRRPAKNGPFPEKEVASALAVGDPRIARKMRGTGIAIDPLKPGKNVAGGRAGTTEFGQEQEQALSSGDSSARTLEYLRQRFEQQFPGVPFPEADFRTALQDPEVVSRFSSAMGESGARVLAGMLG